MTSIRSWLNRPPASTPEACRYYGFDTVRSISALLVVGCHLPIQTSESAAWCFRYNQFAVPLFAAISGFLLSQSVDRDTTETILRKRVARILPLHIVWTVVYLIAFSLTDYFLNIPDGYLRNMSLIFLVKAFLRGCATVHLWFLPSLLCSSIALVFLDRFLPRQKWLYLVVSALVLSLGAVRNSHFVLYDMRLFGYLLMGFGLFRILGGATFTNLAKAAIPFWCIGVLSFSWLRNLLPDFCLEYVIVLMTMIVFSDKRIPGNRISAFFSSTSLHVYLVHLLVAYFVTVAIRHFYRNPLGPLMVISMWLFIFFFSAVFSFFCGKLTQTLRRFCTSHIHIAATREG